MRDNGCPGLVGRVLSAAAALVFAGGALWVGLVLYRAAPSAPPSAATRRAPVGARPGALRITDGPALEAGPDGHLFIRWRTNLPADSYVDYERPGSPPRAIAKDGAYVTEHRFAAPVEPFVQFMRFLVMSVAETGEEARAEIGPGAGGRSQVFPSITADWQAGRAAAPVEALAWADHDADGRLDVALCSTRGGDRTLLVWRARSGDFAVRRSLPPASALRSLCRPDYNADGLGDLLAVGDRLTFYMNAGPPDWALRKVNVFGDQAGGGVALAAVADLNADGLPDVAALTRDGRLVLHVNGGPPEFRFVSSAPAELPPAAGQGPPRALVAADFTGDGRVDLLVVGDAPVLLAGDGDGFAALDGALPPAPGAGWVAASDRDGDGDLDIYLGGASGRLLDNEGGGRFGDVTDRSAELAALEGGTRCGCWSDVDGNGYPDLVVAPADGGLRLFLNDGAGAFMDATSLCRLRVARGSVASAVAALDLDEDGSPDLCVLHEDGSVTLLANRWRAAPGRAYLVVRPQGRGAVGAVVTLLDRVTDEPLAMAVAGVGRGDPVAVPPEVCFGVVGLSGASVRVRFSDGLTNTVAWSGAAAGRPLLIVGRTAPRSGQ